MVPVRSVVPSICTVPAVATVTSTCRSTVVGPTSFNDRAPYRDLGADYYTRLNPDKIKNRAIDQLTAIGYTITLTSRPLTSPQPQ